MAPPDPPLPDPAGGAASAARGHWPTGRRWAQAVAVVLALAVAWLLVRAYRQPGFIVDFANFLLC